MTRWGVRAAIGFAFAGAACGGGGQPSLTGPATHYLLSLDQLITPDFTVYEAAHTVDANTLAQDDAAQASRLHNAGLRSAAQVQFSRTADFATVNGPIDIICTVALFGDAQGAHTIFTADVRMLDSASGATPISTGPLGDEAHADSIVRQAPNGLRAVQITLMWRRDNAVNLLVVRGRYGGTRLDDALILAHRISERE
ncbi:MAG TPA: hypothetical protein VJU79_09180 [Candidatus Dormibacteraeota bacterium]|nr:hypothetical protein [Candidatus Dormibacteraeota bacterium]